MSERTLYLAWQDDLSGQWFAVGRLDADVGKAAYRFRYTGGAERAEQEAGFPPLLEFPDLRGDYQSSELFPLFANRVMNRRRPDYLDYLRGLDLPAEADTVDILSANGGRRETDSYEVFPKIEKDLDGGFRCRFHLHVPRQARVEDGERIKLLRRDEPLSVTLRQSDRGTDTAVQIKTADGHMIGWSPDYLMHDLAAAMAEPPGDCRAMVVRSAPPLVPWRHRVLIEVQGRLLADHEPMSGSDFQPLVS